MTRMVNAVMDALEDSIMAPLVKGLSIPRYPLREMTPRNLSDGSVMLTVWKRGWGYKQHAPPAQTPPEIDTAAIQDTLTAILHLDFVVLAVEDKQHKINIILKEKHYEN